MGHEFLLYTRQEAGMKLESKLRTIRVVPKYVVSFHMPPLDYELI
jgi:hypothetical protein